MTALLEALRRIETQRPTRAPVAPAPVEAASVAPAVETPAPATISMASATVKRREKPAPVAGHEPPLNTRATVASDIEAAAAAITHRFRAPSLVALVTCGNAEVDAEIIEAIGAAIQSQGFATKIFDAADGEITPYALPALVELRKTRGYHLLHTTTAAALQQSPLLALADGVVLLVELARTPIQEAEAAVGMLRREAVAVSGILVIE